MNTHEEQAFSKLMIAGEYAVLFGSNALVAAVLREARCIFSAQNDWQFIADTGTTTTSSLEHPLFVSVKKTLARHNMSLSRGKYVLDTSKFFNDQGQKLGLGSSAAATVALCKMAMKNVEFDPWQLFFVAKEAHQSMFGYGSGADIAASIFGGSFFFEPNKPVIHNHDLLMLWRQLVFVDVKKPTSTEVFIDSVLRLKGRDPGFIEDFSNKSALACQHLQRNFDFSSSIHCFDVFFSLLETLGKKAQIDIISDEHALVFSIAKKWGGSAKPSGAGGGDIALALVPEENHRCFRREMIDVGFSPIDLTLAPSLVSHHDL